ncbi:hypothetical protein, partial [Streptomyces beijiangensis]|nr:hypothetical protein [Streptomyces beijiangensis]
KGRDRGITHHSSDHPHRSVHDSLDPLPEVQSSAPLRDHNPRKIHQNRSHLVPVQMQPHRMPRSRHQPQHS